MFDDIGDYLEACEIFLQDPKRCDLNVRYRNPHRLSGLSDNAPFTLEHQIEEFTISQEALERSLDYLAEVDTKRNLAETPTPQLLQTDLYK
jgi:hypothetical protein